MRHVLTEADMARVETRRLEVLGEHVRQQLREAAATSGDAYEKTLGGAIAKRWVPIMEMIEAETAIPIATVSQDKTRRRRSSQARAVFQWQRGHRLRSEGRQPDATVEFKGSGGLVTCVYALEISLQTDVTRIGSTRACRMSMSKASQLPITATVLAGKPSYAGADIHYWYLCPWEPLPESQAALLAPLQAMKGTDNVVLT